MRPLPREQVTHFSEHGWLLLENVLSEETCETYLSLINDLVAKRAVKQDRYRIVLDHLLLLDSAFFDLLGAPGFLDAVEDLMGAHPFLVGAKATIGLPSGIRDDAGEDVSQPSAWGWHRGMRPKWILVRRDDDSNLVHSEWINTVTYLTDVDVNSGGTPLLDGSHKHELGWLGWHRTGDYNELSALCPLVQIKASAGSVLMFGESLFHAVPPVLADSPSYKLVYGFWPSWWNRDGRGVPPSIAHTVADERLQYVLDPTPLWGQGPSSYQEEVRAIRRRADRTRLE